jgi:hypothetical protein
VFLVLFKITLLLAAAVVAVALLEQAFSLRVLVVAAELAVELEELLEHQPLHQT